MTIEEQINNLSKHTEEFVGCINSLPEGLFLKKLDEWAPRDILAHLIGWNRLTIQGCQQIMKGQTPSFFIDPGHDFSKVNAVLVQRYDSKDRQTLIEELNASARELKQFLLTIDSARWDTDYGVTYKGETVTVMNMVDALARDFVHHKIQIEKWVESLDI